MLYCYIPSIMKTINFGKKSIKVVKHSKSKYMRLSVSAAGEVKLTVPLFIKQKQIDEFLRAQQGWLNKVLKNSRLLKKVDINSGNTLQMLGQEYKFVLYENHPENKVFIDDQSKQIHVFTILDETKLKQSGNRQVISDLLKQEIVEKSREYISEKAEEYAQQIGTTFNRIAIREQKSRWGSCSSLGNLNFNWKIVLAPPAVCDYVIAHEVCHLIEHNHSHNFWALVEKVCPQFKDHKDWLKSNAHKLEVI